MIISRNGKAPSIHPSAKVAASAQIIGDVTIGKNCYIDYNAVIESGGPPVRIEDDSLVFANTVIRSVGGMNRPAFPVRVGHHTVIGPLCALVGCRIGSYCYIATGAMIFQGTVIGDKSRVGAGSIVHFYTVLPPKTRVGMRNIAVRKEDGFLITSDVETARKWIAKQDFFKSVFEVTDRETSELQAHVASKLLQEMLRFKDKPIG